MEFAPPAVAWAGTFHGYPAGSPDAMQEEERIVLLGEDLRDPYGGAFKVTAGLSARF